MVLAPALRPNGVLTLQPSAQPSEEGPAAGPNQGWRTRSPSAPGTASCRSAPTRSGRPSSGLVLLAAFRRALRRRALLASRRLRTGWAARAASAASELERIAAAVPPMTGGEYVTTEVLADLWRATDTAFATELAESKLTAQEFLRSRNKAWNLVGRVHFNLAENRKDEAAPFAFLATYTTRLSAQAKPQHLPLGKALQEYAGAKNRERLLSLLMPVQRAAEQCAWLKAMVDAGEIYHPLRWTPRQAMQFLKDVPLLEGAGVVIRMPATWRMNRPPSPKVKATVGGKVPSNLGMDALLDFQMEVTLDGETLSDAEVRRLLAETDGLALIRGKWVEVDSERLSRTLDAFQAVERRAAADGLSFGEAMRLLAGADATTDETAGPAVAWSETVAGPWLAETLAALRHPDRLAEADPGDGAARHAPALPEGRRRMALSAGAAGLGACLADDMGLGKTIQVLALAARPEAVRRRGAQAVAARRAGLADCQLVGGDRAVCPEPRGAHRRIHRRAARGTARTGSRARSRRRRSGRSPPTASSPRLPWLKQTAGGWRCSTRRRRSRTPAPGRPGTSRSCAPGPHRLDRHAGREPARRPLVALRLLQSRAARLGQGSSRPSSRPLPSGRDESATGRCATSCGPTSSGA